MNWNYKIYLSRQLNQIKHDLGLDELNLIVAEEQAFEDPDYIDNNTVYVIIKYLASTLTFGLRTTPVQLIILSEGNSLQKAKAIFEKFVAENTQTQVVEDGTFIKFIYQSPTDITNFLMVGDTYRNILYVSGDLMIMEDVLDLTELKIDNVDFEVLNFSISYQMQPNTQPNGDLLCESVKSTATLSLSFAIPFKTSDFATNVLNIASGTTTGNKNFSINFKLGENDFFTTANNFKLTSATITTSKDNIPTLQVGFIR